MYFLIMISIILFSQISFAAPLSVSCRWNGEHWILVNTQNVVIGKQNSFSDQATCEESKATRKGNLICGWNGQYDQIYNLENGVGIGEGYNDVSQCGSILKAQSGSPNNSFICSWNGSYYAPFVRASGQLVSGSRTGWLDYTECYQKSVLKSHQTLICGWNGMPVLYSIEGKPISTDFKSMEDCNGLLELMKRNGASTHAVTGDLNSNLQEGFTRAESFQEVGFPMKICEVKEHRYHLTKNEAGYLTKECSPEVLYSWGSFDKLQWFTNNLNDKKKWVSPLPRGLFTTPSAAGTFGYGPIAIRLKIKPSARFKLLVSPPFSTCDDYVSGRQIKAAEYQNTIIVRLDLRSDGYSFADYTVCSPEVIESWSYGTKEHFDEILRDHNWMTTQHYYNWDAYVKLNGVDKYLDNTLDNSWAENSTTYSLEVIQRRMSLQRALIEGGFGEILFNNPANKQKHFKITKPNYFLQSK